MTTKSSKRGKATSPLFPVKDVRAYIRSKAALIAPADVEALVAREREVLERAEAETDHPRLRRQAELAARILGDHATGSSPQIPYFTISLLAVALFYFLDPADLIPDWIPKLGTSDDALVSELAFEMGAAGVQRYCDWKGVSTDGILPVAKPHPTRARRK